MENDWKTLGLQAAELLANNSCHAPALKQQLKVAKIRMEMTGVGCFVNFSEIPGYLGLGDSVDFTLTSVAGKIRDSVDVVSFALFVRHGVLTMLDVATTGNELPKTEHVKLELLAFTPPPDKRLPIEPQHPH